MQLIFMIYNVQKGRFFLDINIYIYLFNYITFGTKCGIIKNNESSEKILDYVFIIPAIYGGGGRAVYCRRHRRRGGNCRLFIISFQCTG